MEGDGTGRPPLGRGGRGDQMRRALEMYKRRPGAGQESSAGAQAAPDYPGARGGPGGDAAPAPAQAAAPSPAPAATSQAARLQALLEKHNREKAQGGAPGPSPAPAPATASAATPIAATGVSPPAPTGAGRARAMQLLMERHKRGKGGGESAPGAAAAPTAPGPPQSSEAPAVERLQRRFQHMEIDTERAPVIKKGTAGRPANLYTNHIGMRLQPGRAVHEYELRFTPYQDSMSLRFRLLRHENVRSVIGRASVHDGGKYYLPVRLPEQVTSIPVPHPTPGNADIVVEFVYKKEMPLEACTHLLNICIKRIMGRLKLTEVRRQYFDSAIAVQIPKYKMEVWPGFVTAVHCYEGGIKLNVDVAHRVLHTSTAMDCIEDAFNTRRGEWQNQVFKTLVGQTVMTRYNKKTYRVDDIDYSRSPKEGFQLADGSTITFVEYYKKNYMLDIRNHDQPLLISRPKKRDEKEAQMDICLIPELCHMTGLTDAQRADHRMMKELHVQTAVKPENRVRHLDAFIRRIKNCPEAAEVLEEWGLSLDDSVSKLVGRQLEPERLRVGHGREILPDNRDYSWDRGIKSNKVLTAVELRCWAVVYFFKNEPQVLTMVQALMQACQNIGVMATKPQMLSVNNERTENFITAMRQIINPQLQLILSVMPSQRDDRYAAIKQLCYVDMPVASQVVNFRTINKEFVKLKPIAHKIAMQMNCKLGGELWSCKMPVSSCMTCGVDVYHDKAMSSRGSVLAFVSALNRDQTRFFSQARVQKPGQELGDTLSMCLLTGIRQWHQANNSLPEHIVIFRDGVSDGQLEATLQHEVRQYESVFATLDASYQPKLNVIIVQKRINVRVFRANGSAIENPGPGTVVDHNVTARHLFDFYLVSQHVNQGTVSPTHYIVLRDAGYWPPDVLQKLSYKACHLYYNWCGTVRVPAPVQYAHKLAAMVGQVLHKHHNDRISDRLFYL